MPKIAWDSGDDSPVAHRVPTARADLSIPVRWAFLLFVTAIPLELLRLDIASRSVTLAKLAGVPLVAVYLWSRRREVAGRWFPRPAGAVWWFAAYVGVYAVGMLWIADERDAKVVVQLVTLIQLLFFLWIVTDLLRDATLARQMLLAYSVGAVCWALVATSHMSVRSLVWAESRFWPSGIDPNAIASFLVLGTVMLFGRWQSARCADRIGRLAFPALAVPTLVVVSATGSRTAHCALLVGLLVYVIPWRTVCPGRRLRSKLAAIFLLVALAGSSPVMRNRWAETFTDDPLKVLRQSDAREAVVQRQQIIRMGLGMYWEAPLLGWGPGQYQDELGIRVGLEGGGRDAHNLILHLLLECGLAGATPFLAGVALCAASAWRGRRRDLGQVALAALATMLAANIALPLILTKPLWLALAFAAATPPDVAQGSAAGSRLEPPRDRATGTLTLRTLSKPTLSSCSFFLAAAGMG